VLSSHGRVTCDGFPAGLFRDPSLVPDFRRLRANDIPSALRPPNPDQVILDLDNRHHRLGSHQVK
jgi:hypothetical protein